jgi:hypothetical protein
MQAAPMQRHASQRSTRPSAPRGTLPIPEAACVIAVGIERSTVVLVDGAGHRRDGFGEVLRCRMVGVVRLLGADGQVLVRRRMVSPSGSGELMLTRMVQEVHAAVVAAPRLAVGLVHNGSDADQAPLVEALERLARRGVIRRYRTVIDRGVLRTRLGRAVAPIQPDPDAREALLDRWDACIDASDTAIDGIIGFLAAHRAEAERPAVMDEQLRWLSTHRDQLGYAASGGDGFALRRMSINDELSRPRLFRADL